MTTTAVDLALPIRTALLANATVVASLAAYKGSLPIFTRRPAPTDAPFPMIMISPDISITDQDGIDDFRPIQERDVAIYGQNSSAAKYRAVETLAFAIRDLFHFDWRAITVTDWKVIQINARGPVAGPTDDDQTIGRIVSLSIQLARKA